MALKYVFTVYSHELVLTYRVSFLAMQTTGENSRLTNMTQHMLGMAFVCLSARVNHW